MYLDSPRKYLPYLILFYLLTIYSIVPAQKNNHNYEYFTTKNGLSHNFIRDIFQDHDGFMWFGTLNGLNRYDGSTFTTYLEDTTNAITNSINHIYQDSEKNLWVSSNQGLNLYDRAQNDFIKIKIDNAIDIVNKSIHVTCEDSLGYLWIGGYQGLYRMNKRTHELQPFHHNPNDSRSIGKGGIMDMQKDKSGNIWIATWNSGLCRYSYKEQNFERFELKTAVSEKPKNYKIFSLYVSENGDLYIGYEGGRGFSKYSHDNNEFHHYNFDLEYTHAHISEMIEDRHHRIWFTVTVGIDIFDPKSQKFSEEAQGINNILMDFSARSIHKDRQNNIWIGSLHGAIRVSDTDRPKYYKTNNNKPMPLGIETQFLYEDSTNNLWYGGLYHLNYYNPTTKDHTSTIIPTDIDENGDIRTLLFESRTWYENELHLFETSTGYLYYNFENQHYQTFKIPCLKSRQQEGNLYKIHNDHMGNLWLLYTASVGYYNMSNNTLTIYPIKGIVNFVKKDSKGNIWIGSHLGLLKSKNKNKFARGDTSTLEMLLHFKNNCDSLNISYVDIQEDFDFYSKNDELHSNIIEGLVENKNGELWVFTNVGVQKLEKDSKPIYYTANPNKVTSISFGKSQIDDKGDIWFTTMDGIKKLLVRENKIKHYKMLKNDQNQGNHEIIKLKNGHIALSDGPGFSVFNPNEIDIISEPPEVHIKEISILKAGVESSYKDLIYHKRELSLSYFENNFRFKFCLLNFEHPSHQTFAYQLVGYDEGWKYTDTKSSNVEYSDIPPGKYTLKVKGADGYGIWSDKTDSLTIVIAPPFWTKWWFILIGITITLVGLIIWRITIIQTKERSKTILQDKVKEKTEELHQSNERLRQISDNIKKKNIRLDLDNKGLTKEVKTQSISRALQISMNYEEFQKSFPTERACYELIANLKWADGYECIKCHNVKYSEGQKPFSKRCSKCGYVESITINTIFHKLKFPIIKALYIVYSTNNNPSISSKELSKKLNLREPTCWYFKKKVLDKLKKVKGKKIKSKNWKTLIVN